jgi:hypothetical protein
MYRLGGLKEIQALTGYCTTGCVFTTSSRGIDYFWVIAYEPIRSRL